MIRALLTDPAHGRARSLTAAILAAALTGCGFGLLMPLVSLNLEAMTGSATIVGWNTTAAAISTLVATPFIPMLLSRLPARPTMTASLFATAVGLILFPLWRDVWLWWALRFATGLTVTIVFVASETWINQLARPEARAKLLAVYATVLSGGFAAGGLVLALLGSQGFAPWIAGFAIFAIGAIPVMLLKGPELAPPEAGESGLRALMTAVRLAPAAILAGLVYGAMETGLFTLVPVYAERLGLSVTAIGLLAMTGALGGIALQIPIGAIADRQGRARTLLSVAALSAVLPLVILIAGAFKPALFPLLFLYGGIAGSFYTLGLSMLGERLSGGMLAVGNAAFVFAFGLGSLVGPPVSGAAMDAMDPGGLMLAFSATAGLYLVIALLVFARRRH